MKQTIDEDVIALMRELSLPDHYIDFVKFYLTPLADQIISLHSKQNAPVLIGINGAQGTGKTTLCQFLCLLLNIQGKKVVTLSIDDFYLSRAERSKLANQVHPLLQTRGVPGTHNMRLMADTLGALLSQQQVRLPAFDKSVDDCVDQALWPLSPVDTEIVLFEGWCVGAGSIVESELDPPVNNLEREEDPEKIWRKYICDQLNDDYQCIFNRLDYLIMLKAPSFDLIYQWRLNQEKQLVKKAQHSSHIMDENEIARFIQYYERLTKMMLKDLPAKSDSVLHLNEDQVVTHMTGKDELAMLEETQA